MTVNRTIRLSAIFLGVCVASPAWGFPGPPPTLDKRWAHAPLVVHAHVVSAKQVRSGQNVVLRILEVLKSRQKEQPKEISVRTRSGGCPYPFFFHEGTKVVAFLEFVPEYEAFQPWGASWGCIEVDNNFKQYAEALKKLPRILTQPKAERDRLLVQWYVDCAIKPSTRWDGALGISHYLYLQRSSRQKKLVTRAHLDRLVRALVGETPPAKDAAELVRSLRTHPSPALDQYLLKCLRRSHMPGWQDVTREAVDYLPERLKIKLEPTTQAMFEEWDDLLSILNRLEYEEKDSELLAQEKQRHAILWGALSAEVYHECKHAMDDRK